MAPSARPGVKPMPEDGGKPKRDPAAGDPQQRGNQQAPVLLAERTSSMRDVQQPGPGEQDGGVSGGHGRGPGVVEAPTAQIAPQPQGDLAVGDRRRRSHAGRRRGHCAQPWRRIIRPPPPWPVASAGRTGRGRGRSAHRAPRGVQRPARGPRRARRLDPPDAPWTAGWATTIVVRPSAGAFQALQHQVLRFGVERGRGLVEHQQARIAGDGARDGDALRLAARQAEGALADLGLETVPRGLDEVGCGGNVGRPGDLARPNACASEANVVGNGPMEEDRVLGTRRRRAGAPRWRSATPMVCPSSRTSPALGWRNRSNRLTTVDFPAPLGPTIAVVEPPGTRNDTSCSTGVSAM